MKSARSALFVLLVVLSFAPACTDGPTPADPPPCDQLCLDGIAVLGVRLTLKQVFNATLQGQPVGKQDFHYDCPLGGKAHVFGTASSNAVQGASEVDLTYELQGCVLLNRDTDPKANYTLATTGTVTQKGTLSVQPTATTSIGLASDSITITGTVYDPAVPYDQKACKLTTLQDGNVVKGTICGRDYTTSL